MSITAQTDLSRYVGGRITVTEGQSFTRGLIKSLRVEGRGKEATLIVEYAWKQRSRAFPVDLSKGFEEVSPTPYRVRLADFGVTEIPYGRLWIFKYETNYSTQLYPR